MTIAAAFVAVSMDAQIYVGGSLGFNSTSYQQDGLDSETTITILPEIGYNLTDDFAVGATFGYESWGDDDNAFTVAPYARYTFLKSGAVNLFVDGGLSYTSRKDQYSDLSIGFKPGVAVNLTEKFSFVTHVGFLGFTEHNPKGDDNNVTDFGLNLDGNFLTFGFYYNF